MKRVFNAIAGVGLALTMGIAAVAPARAATVQEFNTTYSQDAKGKGLVAAITTEIYRNQYLNRPAVAACLSENFIPHAGQTNDFDIIIRALLDSKNPANESVESYIAGTMLKKCGNVAATDAASPGTAAPLPASTLTPMKDFFAVVPNDTDKLLISRMAIATQALRASGEGHQEYAKCILSKLYTLQADGTPPAGFIELYRQLGVYRASDTPIEKFFIGAIKHYCGDEPVDEPGQQASAKPDATTPVPN